MDLRLRSRKAGDVTVVEVGGEVELHSASQLRDELSRASESEHPCVIVDLSRVSFIDSTGLGVLVGAFKRVRERGHLALVCPQRSVRRILEITGLGQVFPLFNRVEDALASFPLKDDVNINVRSAGSDVKGATDTSDASTLKNEGGERHEP